MIEKIEKSKNSLKKEIIEWAFCFIVAYIIYVIINYFIGTVSGVKQVSMYPTAKPGERVIISRRVIFPKPLEKGMIITFEGPDYDPANMQVSDIAQYEESKGLNKFLSNVFGTGKKSYIKRIIATAGDRLFISEDGKVFVNDKELDEKYLNGTVTTRTGEKYNLVVPKDTVFVMGDNRPQSRDSREFGAVPLNKVEGNVVTRVWPLNRMGKLDK